MATTANEPAPSSRDESSDSGSGSDSENDTPKMSTPTAVEWLATGRSKRSTAGNRMKSMLANEEPDSDLELLFAEDDNDEGFTDVDDAGSDVQMDSSSDDEDEQNRGDDFEGEKELEKQTREKKLASRKRKAQDAIPAKFRKKVRIDQAAAPAPRPKKKSERTSWLPSPGDMPIRASLRQTTMLSKEQLHQQMKEREAKRLKQLAVMEKKAKKLEAMKKPPMTQAERLAEAALVEKRNAKSLNRWEVAEKAREEERLAKLAALNNRTLKGPVITYWSGIGKWENHLKHVGKVAEEEKAPRKKREKKDKGDKAKGKDKDEEASKKEEGAAAGAASTSLPPSTTPDGRAEAKPGAPSASPAPADAQNSQPSGAPRHSLPLTGAPLEATPAVKDEDRPHVMTPSPTPQLPAVSPAPPRPEDKPRLMAPPSIPPPPSLNSSLMAPPPMPPPPKTSPSVLAAPVLAPPVLAPPLGGIHLVQHTTQPKSNVLAPPNTTQHKSPLSMPAPPPPPSVRPPAHPLAPPHPPHPTQPTQPVQLPAPPKPALPTVTSTPPPPATPAPAIPPAPEEPPPSEVARNAFILRSFDEELIRDKTVQTQILFGRRMDRLAKPAPRPVCVITAHTARYRDPETGLPYFNAYAYREIQRLRRGEYKWSSLLGAWVGSCTYAARGVPERFLKGGEPKVPKTKEVAAEEGKGNATVGEGTESQKTKADQTTPPVQAAVEEPPTKTGDATVPLSPPLAPQTQTQTQTQQLPQPPAEAQNQDQDAKPATAKPVPQPGATSVPPAV
ncbi:YL1-domain-containing protein [Colletotrichum eremochloae]|nr:YL1-domain-containing protein [Colletotrichum eremochloae]